jgi:Mg2+ and Co2+ transporter CorA
VRPEIHEPTDPHALRMENDLIAAENAAMRARLEESKRQVRVLERKLAAQAAALEGAAQRRDVIDDDTVAELRRARSDLRWFIQRLSGSPVGWMLRRWEGFRALEERWLR